MNSEMYRKYHVELQRLDGEIAHYDRLWTQVPYFALAALLAPVVGIMWGWAAMFVELLVTAALVGVRAYLISMRKSEIVWNRARLVEELGERSDAARGASAVRAHGQPA